MNSLKNYLGIAIAALAFVCLNGCSDPVDDGNEPNEDQVYAENLWTEVAGYEDWDLFPGTVDFNPSAAPHGAFARIYANDTAQADTANLADGSLLIKHNFQSDTEGDYDSVTLMEKRAGYSPDAGDWFWAKYNPDGTVQTNAEGAPLAGRIGLGGTAGCIPCHAGAADDDYVFLNDAPDPGFGGQDDITMYEDLWTNTLSDYQNWNLMPNTVDFEPSEAPHGMFARIYINATMEGDPTAPADGSVVIKENYATDTEGDFDAITIMVKTAGYSPEAGDWFWAKANPDGTYQTNGDGVPLVGRIGINGGACIGCHSAEADYVFKN